MIFFKGKNHGSIGMSGASLFLAPTAIAFMTSCKGLGGSSRPSETAAMAALRSYLVSATHHANECVMDGAFKASEVTSVEILQWGEYNEQLKYWPVQIKWTGTATCAPRSMLGGNYNFNIDWTYDMLLIRDDYGNLVAKRAPAR